MHTLDLTKPRQHRTRLDRLGMTRRRGLKRTSTGRRPKALPREAGCLRLRRHERMFDRITIKSVQERDSGIPGTAQRRRSAAPPRVSREGPQIKYSTQNRPDLVDAQRRRLERTVGRHAAQAGKLAECDSLA